METTPRKRASGTARTLASGFLLAGLVVSALSMTNCLRPDFSKECGPDAPPCFKGETCHEGTCYPEGEAPITPSDTEQPPTDTRDRPDTALDTGADTGDAADTRADTPPEPDSFYVEDADPESDADTRDPCWFGDNSNGVCAKTELAPTGPCEPPPGYSETELCDDPLDNDCDGRVNEGCECPESGAERSCYRGPKWAFGNGECSSSGEQFCSEQEPYSILTWGVCEGGNQMPEPEDCSKEQEDNDCDGKLPAEDKDCL